METFEKDMVLAMTERTIRRLWILCILLIILLVGSNLGWLYYESQFEPFQTVEQDIDTGDGSAIVNGIGDINYGTDKTDGN